MDELLRMWRGREFQVVGAATAKLREPKHMQIKRCKIIGFSSTGLTKLNWLLPHCHWVSVIRGCPSSVIRPSLLLLPILGTVCPIMSRPHPLCLFSEVASRLSSSGVPSHDFTATFIAPVQLQFVLFTYVRNPLNSFPRNVPVSTGPCKLPTCCGLVSNTASYLGMST